MEPGKKRKPAKNLSRKSEFHRGVLLHTNLEYLLWQALVVLLHDGRLVERLTEFRWQVVHVLDVDADHGVVLVQRIGCDQGEVVLFGFWVKGSRLINKRSKLHELLERRDHFQWDRFQRDNLPISVYLRNVNVEVHKIGIQITEIVTESSRN